MDYYAFAQQIRRSFDLHLSYTLSAKVVSTEAYKGNPLHDIVAHTLRSDILHWTEFCNIMLEFKYLHNDVNNKT